MTDHLLTISFSLSSLLPSRKNNNNDEKKSNEKNSDSNVEKNSCEHGFPAGLNNLQAFTFSFSHQSIYPQALSKG